MQNKTISKRKIIYGFVAWFIVGILLLCAAFFTCANNYRELSFSLDNNGIYEIKKGSLRVGMWGQDHYKEVIPVDLSELDEKYLRVKIDGVTSDNVRMTIRTGSNDRAGTFFVADRFDEHPLKNGTFDFELSVGDFRYVVIDIYGAEETVLKDVQIRESIKKVSIIKALPVMAITAIAYSLMTWGAMAIWRKRGGSKDEPATDSAPGKHSKKSEDLPPLKANRLLIIPASLGSVIRTALFFVIMAVSIFTEMGALGYNYGDNSRDYIITQLILIALIVLFLPDKKHQLERHGTDKGAIIVCACLALYTLLSDILVEKSTGYTGIAVFIVLLAFAYVWNSCAGNEDYIADFERAIQLFLLLLAILSVVCRYEQPLGRFSGPVSNPSVFALYLGGIWAVLLGSLEKHIHSHSRKIDIFITLIEMAITLLLLFLSQSLTPMIAAFAATLLWIFRFIVKRKGAKTAIITMVAFIVSITACLVCLTIYVRRPEYEATSRLLAKMTSSSLSSFLSSRDYYWRAYLRNMNMFGHDQKPFLWDHRVFPHNAILGMAYTYGVPCIVPYIIMMMMAIEKAYRYAGSGLKYSAIPLYSIVTFIIMSVADNVERTLAWLPWIACYLLMAPLLLRPVDEIKHK